MSIRFQAPGEGPSTRAERYLQLVVAVLHVVLAGMLLYFRFGPAAAVIEQLRDRGVAVPGWLPLGMTVGTLFVAGFLAVRGLHSYRGFRGGRGSGR
jgi:hypothetical protein